MDRSRYLSGWLICLLLFLWNLVSPVPLSAQGPNLLQNPGFERPYAALPNKENCLVAVPWVAWWIEGSPDQVREGYLLAPEYKLATRADYPGNRVRSGELAQQYFHSFGNFQAGVWQQVHNIPVGARLRFELWGMAWSCDNEAKGNCGGATSGDGSPMHFRIGIHPTGGVNPLDPQIVWSPEQDAFDAWHLFQVEAVAQSTTVTVFVYSYPEYRSQDNNIYLDDASLVIVALPPTATPRPTRTPTFTLTPAPTDTSTATNTPTATGTPTSTLTPTSSPTATRTDTPTSTLTSSPTASWTPTSTETPSPSPTATASLTATPSPSPTATPGRMAVLANAFTSGPEMWIILLGVLLIGVILGQAARLVRGR